MTRWRWRDDGWSMMEGGGLRVLSKRWVGEGRPVTTACVSSTVVEDSPDDRRWAPVGMLCDAMVVGTMNLAIVSDCHPLPTDVKWF